ncbi:MAG: heme ABC exporter ATP-binding protein CcmA [Rhodobacteraceae bacterium]|nr:heme ABC exporter ATP-binding protein CcmA [Paracoccaceae bacterium]
MTAAAPSSLYDTAVLTGDQLACRRGGRLVFARLSFEVGNSQALVLRGNNGSGKTTLMRLIAGLGRATGGALKWNGVPVDQDTEAHGRRLRYAGHLDGIKPAFSVRENVAFWAEVWNAPPDDVDKALAAFGLTHLSGLPARLLSAGQRHRVALSRIVLGRAPLWLLDEPANTLDDTALAALSRVIADHRRKGGMVVMASHGESLIDDAAFLPLDEFARHANAIEARDPEASAA